MLDTFAQSTLTTPAFVITEHIIKNEATPFVLKAQALTGDPMSNELPSIKVSADAKLKATAGSPADDIRRFLAELEAVAESCQTVSTKPTSGERPPTYLEPIAKKYSFAPPRKPLYEVEPERTSAPVRLLNNLKKATISMLGAITNRKS